MLKQRSDWLPPLVIFIALATLAWAGWWSDRDRALDQAERASKLLAEATAHQIREHVTAIEDTLKPLQQKVLDGSVIVPTEFPDAVFNLRSENPEFAAVAIYDQRGNLRSYGPPDFNGKTDSDGLLMELPGHQEALKKVLNGSPAATEVYLLNGGVSAIGILVPVLDEQGKLVSVLYVALDGNTFVSKISPGIFAHSHQMAVIEVDGNKTLAGGGVPGEGKNTATADVLGRKLKVFTWPIPGIDPAGDSRSGIGRLIVYLFSALIIAVTVWVALYERRIAIHEAEERKLIADSLRLSQARLAEIIARSPWPILEHDREGQIEAANEATQDLLKTPVEEIRNHNILEWIHPEDSKQIRSLVSDAATSEGKVTDSRVVREDDSVRYLRWSRINRYNQNGKITGGILFGQDVTASVEASRAQERLIAEEERVIERLWVLNDFARSLRTSLDAQSLYRISISAASNVLANRACAILVYDPVTEMFEVRAARSSMGAALPLPTGERFPANSTQLREAQLESKQLVMDDLSEAATPHEMDLVRHGFRSVAAVPILVDTVCVGLLAAYSAERKGITRDGVEFLQGIAEHLALALTSSRLFSQLTEAYNATRTAQARIIEMEKLRAVGEMTSGIAHDFNNMLMAILGNAEMLDEPDLTDEQRGYLEKIMTAASDAASTVKRLQEYSRNLPDSENFEELDINSIVKDSIDLTKHKWKNQAQSRGIEIQMNRELDSNAPTVRGVASELREVLTNLIFNAVDAMPDGGSITVSTGRRGARTAIQVKDTGAGMTDEVRNKLFTPFFTTKGRQGNGLGLAMSYGIIQKHGGEIEIDSAPGIGTTFSLLFPSAEVQRREDRSPAERTPMPRLKVLVVDDDPDVADAVASLVGKLDHEVKLAESGYDAVKRMKANRFDAVLTDLGMPGMSGKEVALAAKDISPNIPVILLTGWGDQVKAEGEYPPGVDLVLSKPIRLEQLDNALRRVTQARRERATA